MPHIFSIKGISAPTTVQVSEVTDSSALISWHGVDNVNEYQVQWRLLNENVTMTTDVTGGITRITLNNLLPNRQYGVTVSSLTIGVVVNTSAEVPFTTSPTSVTQSTDSMITCNGKSKSTNTMCENHHKTLAIPSKLCCSYACQFAW